mmetsp:Transcript_11246/g.19158  ORF Transcript_11246/g.19158 Transcript_11246/m.19158 type:complete len:106 (-) Transcript_11246:182-499(-)
MIPPGHLNKVDLSEADSADCRGISAKMRISAFLSIIASPSRSNIYGDRGEQGNVGCGLLAKDSLHGVSCTDYVPRAPFDELLAAISKSPITNQSTEDTDDLSNAD